MLENIIRLQPGSMSGVTASRSAGSEMPCRMFQRPSFLTRSTVAGSWASIGKTRFSTVQWMVERITCWAPGTWRSTRRAKGPKVHSGRGMIQAGVRWKTVRCRQLPAISGTIWTADAPVPMIPIRLSR